jgi:hypothetical protein
VVVKLARGRSGQYTQAAGHTEVQKQRSRVELEQKIFGAPPGCENALACDLPWHSFRDWPSQSRLMHSEPHDLAADRMRLNAAAGGLDFRKLGQGRLFDLRFLVGDVLARDWIEFAHFHLVRVQALVLRRHVEVAGAGRG